MNIFLRIFWQFFWKSVSPPPRKKILATPMPPIYSLLIRFGISVSIYFLELNLWGFYFLSLSRRRVFNKLSIFLETLIVATLRKATYNSSYRGLRFSFARSTTVTLLCLLEKKLLKTFKNPLKNSIFYVFLLISSKI